MPQILVIDDDAWILNMMRLALTRFDYQVETAETARQGIQKFDESHFDLVITDIRMPGLSGDHVLGHIRKSPKQSTPVIGFSGTPWLLKDTDFDMVLSKPFALKEMLSAVGNLLTKPPLTAAYA